MLYKTDTATIRDVVPPTPAPAESREPRAHEPTSVSSCIKNKKHPKKHLKIQTTTASYKGPRTHGAVSCVLSHAIAYTYTRLYPKTRTRTQNTRTLTLTLTPFLYTTDYALCPCIPLSLVFGLWFPRWEKQWRGLQKQ